MKYLNASLDALQCLKNEVIDMWGRVKRLIMNASSGTFSFIVAVHTKFALELTFHVLKKGSYHRCL